MALGKFCCCIELRLGCIVWAVLGLISNVVCGIAMAKDKDHSNVYFIISANVIGSIACFCLLFGAIKNNWIAVLVYLVVDMLKMVLYVISGIISFTYIGPVALWNGIFITNGIVLIAIALVPLYFWICVFSFFKKLREVQVDPAI